MLKRKAYDHLQKFASEHSEKCLVIRGARQVGKTYLVDTLGQSGMFRSYISVNFLQTPLLKQVFDGNLDVPSLLMNFSVLLPEAKFIPGSTLLFLDEIQECPSAVTSLKFWAKDQRFKVVASGSMLGIDFKRPESYPVGSVDYLDMYPLDFQEFLWANQIDQDVISMLHQHFLDGTVVPEAINEQILHYLKIYMVVGGMPEVVNTYLATSNMQQVDARQKSILQDYRYDIAHYASADIKMKAENCYFSLPDQLGKENHKFQYSVVEKGGSRRKYESCLDWLDRADLLYYCRNLRSIESPLRNFSDEDNFRAYPGDIGLLTAMYDASVKQGLLFENSPIQIGQAKGGIYEALIADLLIKNGYRELYFYKNEKTKTEVEFIVPTDDGIIPIEVKAGNSRSRSLDRILLQENIPYGYKLISGNAGDQGKKKTRPLYMAMFL